MESTKDCNRSPLIANNLNDVETTEASNEAYSMDKIFYDDEIPIVEDECLEIQETIEDCDEICFKMEPSANIDRLISPIPQTDYDELKSPLNTFSDCGYESQGSPLSLHEFSSSLNDTNDDLNYLLNDLFPSLA